MEERNDKDNAEYQEGDVLRMDKLGLEGVPVRVLQGGTI